MFLRCLLFQPKLTHPLPIGPYIIKKKTFNSLLSSSFNPHFSSSYLGVSKIICVFITTDQAPTSHQTFQVPNTLFPSRTHCNISPHLFAPSSWAQWHFYSNTCNLSSSKRCSFICFPHHLHNYMYHNTICFSSFNFLNSTLFQT